MLGIEQCMLFVYVDRIIYISTIEIPCFIIKIHLTSPFLSNPVLICLSLVVRGDPPILTKNLQIPLVWMIGT